MADKIKPVLRLITLASLIILIFPAGAESMTEFSDRYAIKLVLADAALDNDGNLYVITNTWTTRVKNLTRILPDRSVDKKFRLDRLDACCAVDPFAVDTDADGNIYILTYQDPTNEFILAKYDSDGNLVEDYADGGILKYRFRLPADLAVRPDGVAYILDQGELEVYAVAPDGSEVMGFVKQHYDMMAPAKLEIGLNDEIFIFDQFDTEFTFYEIPQGILALKPDGTPIEYFGTEWGSINSGADQLNYASFVIDADGSLWALGPYAGAGPISGAYHFDPDGYRIAGMPLEYRLSEHETAMGIIADIESGFIIFEIENVSLVVMRYGPDGKLREKYSAEIFKRSF